MLTMSAYQVFSDTHLTAAARIIKTLYGGFPLACRQWVINTNVKNTGEATHVVFPIALSNVFSIAISVDTPNCVAQTTNVTTTGIDWRLYNTGYITTTVRGIVIGK